MVFEDRDKNGEHMPEGKEKEGEGRGSGEGVEKRGREGKELEGRKKINE